MAYYLSLFSPETYQAFCKSDRMVSGFRARNRNAASRIKPGDRLICYLTQVSRWVGLFEVTSDYFEDHSPIFAPDNDPFFIRFKIRVISWLPIEKGIPIHSPEVWDFLSFTKEIPHDVPVWTGKLRTSLAGFEPDDGQLLEKLILRQTQNGTTYALTETDKKKLTTHRVRREDKAVSVSVPGETDDEDGSEVQLHEEPSIRDSLRVQALLADIGIRMKFKIWIPRNDRAKVQELMRGPDAALLKTLPLNYDDTTLKTIEQIDVLWLKGSSMARAFEVEHTTSIYSGILRMADLLALQPNMDIRLHIVAPAERREKVFSEIRRPVFSLLGRGPLAESCSFIAYDQLEEIAGTKYLEHTSDTLLDEYAEDAE